MQYHVLNEDEVSKTAFTAYANISGMITLVVHLLVWKTASRRTA